METISLVHEGRRRRYLLTPGRGPACALVVFLHGTGGSGSLALEETRLEPFARREGFALALPDGLPVDPELPSRFLSNPQRWNDGTFRPGDKLHSVFDDVGFLSDVIADALARTGADPRKVFLTGFSNGAGLAFRFAAERTEVLAAVAPVAGYCGLTNPKPSRAIPTLFLIGDADPLIPLTDRVVNFPWFPEPVARPGIGSSLAKWAAGIGCHSEVIETRDDAGLTTAIYGPNFHSITIPGLGHHWPGGRGLLNTRIGGAPADKLDANQVIWNFFSETDI